MIVIRLILGLAEAIVVLTVRTFAMLVRSIFLYIFTKPTEPQFRPTAQQALEGEASELRQIVRMAVKLLTLDAVLILAVLLTLPTINFGFVGLPFYAGLFTPTAPLWFFGLLVANAAYLAIYYDRFIGKGARTAEKMKLRKTPAASRWAPPVESPKPAPPPNPGQRTPPPEPVKPPPPKPVARPPNLPLCDLPKGLTPR
jgi:hypothetical protein